MKNLPNNIKEYKRTPSFTEDTVPKGLLRSHTTKAGTWGKIVIEEGKLLYRILEPKVEENELSPEKHGVVEPQVPHEVKPLGKVKFHVEFMN